MRLDPAEFNRFLAHMGQSVDWRRSIDCPCRSPSSGAASPNCPSCHGIGQVWLTPVVGTVALTSQQIQRQWAQFGLWEQGDVVVSIGSDSPLYAIGEFDRVVFTLSSEPFSVTLTRGKERPLLFPVVSIDRADYLLDGVLTPIDPPPEADDDGNLVWTTPPATGMQYSITGRKMPEYFCWGNFPQDRAHHHGADLPRRVVLRRYDLFGRHK